MEAHLEDRSEPTDGSMPLAVRAVVLALVGALLAGALYLISIRGDALLLDLSSLSQRVFCF
jgi:hypothetical protein